MYVSPIHYSFVNAANIVMFSCLLGHWTGTFAHDFSIAGYDKKRFAVTLSVT